MAKCPELFHKFGEYTDACGLGNKNDFKRHIAIAEEISQEYDIYIDKIYLLFPMTASKKLAKYPKDSDIRKNVIKKISDAINNNIRVTTKTVEFWLHDEGVPLKFTTVSPAKIAKKVSLPPDLVSETPIHNVVSNGDIKSKIYSLKTALTPGQISILNEIMIKYDHSDELGALSLALIWAKERMDNE